MSNDIIHVYAESRRDELLYSIWIYSDDMTWYGVNGSIAFMIIVWNNSNSMVCYGWYGMDGYWYWSRSYCMKREEMSDDGHFCTLFIRSMTILSNEASLASHCITSRVLVFESVGHGATWHGMSVMDIIHCMALHCVLCVLCIWILTWHGIKNWWRCLLSFAFLFSQCQFNVDTIIWSDVIRAERYWYRCLSLIST